MMSLMSTLIQSSRASMSGMMLKKSVVLLSVLGGMCVVFSGMGVVVGVGVGCRSWTWPWMIGGQGEANCCP